MTFDSAWLREEEVADHGNVVRHLDIFTNSDLSSLEAIERFVAKAFLWVFTGAE